MLSVLGQYLSLLIERLSARSAPKQGNKWCRRRRALILFLVLFVNCLGKSGRKMTQIIHWAVKMVPDIAEMAMNKFAVCIEFCMQPGQTLRQVALWSASWSLSLMCSLCVKYSTISCWGRCNFIYVPVEWDYLKVRFEWCHKINHDLSFLSVAFIMTVLSVLCNYFPRYYEIHYPVAWIHPNLFSLLFILTLNTLSFVCCAQTFILRSFFVCILTSKQLL